MHRDPGCPGSIQLHYTHVVCYRNVLSTVMPGTYNLCITFTDGDGYAFCWLSQWFLTPMKDQTIQQITYKCLFADSLSVYASGGTCIVAINTSNVLDNRGGPTIPWVVGAVKNNKIIIQWSILSTHCLLTSFHIQMSWCITRTLP